MSRLKGNAGQRTPFGRVPDWKRDAYLTNPSGTAVHLISSMRYGCLETLCGWIEDEDDATQVTKVVTKHTIGWEGLHKCYHCKRMLGSMTKENDTDERKAETG